ncbi:hypothetical protein GCM10008992_18490 [Halorubrum aquaticum]
MDKGAIFGVVAAVLTTTGFILGALFGPLHAPTDFKIGLASIAIGLVLAYLLVYQFDLFQKYVK